MGGAAPLLRGQRCRGRPAAAGSWQLPAPRGSPPLVPGRVCAPLWGLRPHVATRAVAQGSKETAAPPLSLSDIIMFESAQYSAPATPSSAVAPDEVAVAEEKAEELIGRASRVLTTARTILDLGLSIEGESPLERQAGPSAAPQVLPAPGPPSSRLAPGAVSSASVTTRRDLPAGASTSSLTGEELSRTMFGGTAEASERQGSIMRQALQSALTQQAQEGAAAEAGTPGAEAWRVKLAEDLTSGDEDDDEGRDVMKRGSGSASGSSSTAGGGGPERPSWAAALFSGIFGGGAAGASKDGAGAGGAAGSSLQPQAQAGAPKLSWSPLAYTEADLSVPTTLMLKSEESMFAEAARSKVLPPLQSFVELTSAAAPPQRGGAMQAEAAEGEVISEDQATGLGSLGRQLKDGAGRLADGTRYEKLSGVDPGEHGYAKKWEVLRGITGDGSVSWEECWWTASDRNGLREMGAFKRGNNALGGAWQEEWKEIMFSHPTNKRLVIERTAHKWAKDEAGDEWEEKWGEHYEEVGRVTKWADKWAKAGPNVWHERWGEDYDGGGACQKYTDKWAERVHPGGGLEQWGDKWTETFGDGKGTKHGEVWSAEPNGHRYNRWWNEEHYGDGRVRRYGDSTGGEHWDAIEHMDTYYNPIPHFGFSHATTHSPQLWAVPLPQPIEGLGSDDPDDDGLGPGLGRL